MVVFDPNLICQIRNSFGAFVHVSSLVEKRRVASLSPEIHRHPRPVIDRTLPRCSQ